MKCPQRLLPAVFLIVTGLIVHGQSAIPASGGNGSGNGGSVSFTVGQVFYKTNTGTAGSAHEGVQLPYEISVITGIKETEKIRLFCSVYPNPARDLLTLKIENFENDNLSYNLFDANGSLLANIKILSSETTIPVSNLLPALYILKVTDGNKEIITFKIIKH